MDKAIPQKSNKKILHDFGNGLGKVLAHKHKNGGGWVSDEATVDPSVYVGRDAVIIGKVFLGPCVILRDQSSIIGDVVISGDALVKDHSCIIGHVRVDGRLEMSGYSKIEDDAQIQKTATLIMSKHANMRGDSIVVDGTTQLDGMAVVTGGSRLHGNLYFSDAISINAVLEEQPSMIVKGMLPLDFIVDNRGILWFCGDGVPLRFNLKNGEYDSGLELLLGSDNYKRLESIGKTFLDISH